MCADNSFRIPARLIRRGTVARTSLPPPPPPPPLPCFPVIVSTGDSCLCRYCVYIAVYINFH